MAGQATAAFGSIAVLLRTFGLDTNFAITAGDNFLSFAQRAVDAAGEGAGREPASEERVLDIARRVQQELGRAARRRLHDAKEAGAGDRTLQEVLDDAREIYEDLGREIPRWLE